MAVIIITMQNRWMAIPFVRLLLYVVFVAFKIIGLTVTLSQVKMGLMPVVSIRVVIIMPNEYDQKANDRADKHAILMQHINKRKEPALLEKELRQQRITEARWHSVWIGANTFCLMLIVYMIYIFFIKG